MSHTEVHRPGLKYLNGTHWGPMIPELFFNRRKTKEGCEAGERFKEGRSVRQFMGIHGSSTQS